MSNPPAGTSQEHAENEHEGEPEEEEEIIEHCHHHVRPRCHSQPSECVREIFDSLNRKRLQQEFCDFTITVERTEFPVHKLVLSGQSSYFNSMLQRPFEESNEGTVEFQELGESTFSTMLDYMYGEPLAITSSNIEEIVNHADKWFMDHLLDHCREHLSEHWGDIFPGKAHRLADRLNMEETKEAIAKAVNFYNNFGSREDFVDVSEVFIRGVKTEQSLLNNQWYTQLNSFLALLVWLRVNIDDRLQRAIDLMPVYELQFTPTCLIINHVLEMLRDDLFARDSILEKVQYLIHEAHRNFDDTGLEVLAVRSFANKLKIYNFDFPHWEWKVTEICEIKFQVKKTILENNKLFLFGISKCCILDLKSKVVTWLPCLREKRNGASFCLSEDAIYMAGGITHRGAPFTNSIFKLNLSIPRSWLQKPGKLGVVRSDPSLLFHDKKVFIIGGTEKDCVCQRPVPNANRMYMFKHDADKVEPMGYMYFSTPNPKLAITRSSVLIFPKKISSKFQVQVLNVNTNRMDVVDTDFILEPLTRILDVCPRRNDFLVASLYDKPNSGIQKYIYLSAFQATIGSHFDSRSDPIVLIPHYPESSNVASTDFVFARFSEEDE